MARQFYRNENPLGQRIQMGNGSKPAEIVGIAGDVRDQELESKGRPAVYEPAAQVPFNAMYFGIRTSGDGGSLIPAVRSAIRELDAELPLDARRYGGCPGVHLAFPAPLRHAADGDLRRPRPGAGHGRDLRRDLLFGDPGDPGNRHPHGPRCAPRRRPAMVFGYAGILIAAGLAHGRRPRPWGPGASSRPSSSKSNRPTR